MFLAFWGPMPGSRLRYASSCARDGRGDLGHGSGQRPRRHERSHVLDGDELLEELLVESGVEADENRRRLVLRRVIVNLESDLGGSVAVARHRAARVIAGPREGV